MSRLSAFQHFYTSKLFWTLEHLFFIGIPIMIAIMEFPDNPFVFYSVMLGAAVYSSFIAHFEGAGLKSLGIQKKYFKEAVRYLSVPTILMGFVILIGKFILPQAYILQPHLMQNILIYIVFSVPLQQLLFRGFCTWRCSITWKDNWTFIILFNAINFAMMHIVFHNWWFIVGTFLVNIFWSYAYKKYPNLFAFMISHAILGTIYFL